LLQSCRKSITWRFDGEFGLCKPCQGAAVFDILRKLCLFYCNLILKWGAAAFCRGVWSMAGVIGDFDFSLLAKWISQCAKKFVCVLTGLQN
jgi:hypothetical protein